ncbi:MAG: GOLPH3/VPS74 family protein [Sciscionella sp.]
MLIAEDLFLLLLGDTGDEPAASMRSELALAGAVLVELAEQERIGFTEQREDVEAGRVLVRDRSVTGHRALDGSLARLAEVEGSLPKDAISAIADGLRGELLTGLLRRGVLERPAEAGDPGDPTDQEPTILLPGPTEEHIASLRVALREVVRTGVRSDERQLQLLALLSGADLEDAVLEPTDDTTDSDELDRRELLLTEGAWISGELAKALQRNDLPNAGGTGGPFG